MSELKRYSLRHKVTKKLVTFYTQSNEDGEFCIPVQYIIDLDADYPMWLVDTEEKAEEALKQSTEWYNASYDTPTHSYSLKKEELEVVEVHLKIQNIWK